MSHVKAFAGEKFFVKVKKQPPGNNFTNRTIAEGLTNLGILEESILDEEKMYEVPPDFVSTLLKQAKVFRDYFNVYNSVNGDKPTLCNWGRRVKQ